MSAKITTTALLNFTTQHLIRVKNLFNLPLVSLTVSNLKNIFSKLLCRQAGLGEKLSELSKFTKYSNAPLIPVLLLAISFVLSFRISDVRSGEFKGNGLDPLSGDYTVGLSMFNGAGDYATITEALSDLNLKGANGPVRFLLIDSTFNSETLPLNIVPWTGMSSVNNLTIKPDTGVSSVIRGSSSIAAFNIDNADYFTLDGSNADGGTAKNLTVENTNANGSTIRFINDALNNSVKNCVIKGNSITSGVIFFSTTTGSSGNDSNTILNNDITGGALNGIWNVGTGTTSSTKNSGNRILSNRIFDFVLRGIADYGNSAGTLYEGNEIYSNTVQSGTFLHGFEVNSNTVEGFTFRNNYIHDLKVAIYVQVYGIALLDIQTSFTGVIYNNFISLSQNDASFLIGIYDFAPPSANFNIYFNSINIYGIVGGAKKSYCYLRHASISDFRNNILVNSRTGGTGNYAIRVNTDLVSFTSNYNDIFARGVMGNVFGNYNGTEVTNLISWQSLTGKDLNSVSADPKFISITNLHIDSTQLSPVSNTGIPIAGITTDYDGNTRDAVVPDIGADEFSLYGVEPLSGDYTIGLSMFNNAAYATITAALSDLNLRGASGPVKFLLIDSSYISESLPLKITPWEGMSSVNTLTIKPDIGVSSAIRGSSSTATFNIDNGDYFILDGSNVDGGTTKNLTVENTNANGSTIRFINDALNNSVKNCVIKGNSITSGVIFFSTTTGSYGNDSNTILNNDITGGALNGIWNVGTGTTSSTKNSGNRILSNRIFDFVFRGIADYGNSAGTLYEGNEIYSITARPESIFLACFEVNSSTIEGFTFRNNYLHDLKVTGSVPVHGIALHDIQAAFTGDIHNNFISLSDANSNDLRGIGDVSASGVKYNVYFNSINIYGTVTGSKIPFAISEMNQILI
ncbi:MAG: hypothetical protein IPL53_21060 [Ignavibacteria bacterium]|nr:hypothetical protein [Ignavibacteria bacterium]